MQRRFCSLVVATCWLMTILCARGAGAGLTMESPEVKKSIERGVHWLETASNDPRMGAKALVGLVLVKNGAPLDHPKILEAVEAVRKYPGDPNDGPFIYHVGLATVFLTSLDPVEYRADIQKLLGMLETYQKPHGGWGYTSKPTGDTSMTQYGVLALWEARQAGISYRMSMVEKVMDWLLRTQDPSGAFGYQGVVADSASALVAQTEVRPSVAAAGTGSIYACADLLGLVKRKEDMLPGGVTEVRKERQYRSTRVDAHAVKSAEARGNRWLETNNSFDCPFVHYYLYARERYWSLREDAEGIEPKDPAWYSETASYLLRTQKENGSWSGECSFKNAAESVPDTCFSLLFLLRSMKKSIEKARDFGPGLLVGGRGLPKGKGAVVVRGGQVVAKPLSGPGQQLMAALENMDSPEFDEAVEAMAELPADEARKLVAQNEGKLRELIQGASPEARRAVVQAMGRSDDMDNVPTLIYAMKDQDASVVLAARDSLRRISRKLDAFILPDDFTEAQRAEAIRVWKEWYLAVRPDAEFEN